MGVMIHNYWTTIIGFIAGAAYYLGNTGLTMPTDKQGWINLLIGMVLAGLGLAAKDAVVGSAPPGVQK